MLALVMMVTKAGQSVSREAMSTLSAIGLLLFLKTFRLSMKSVFLKLHTIILPIDLELKMARILSRPLFTKMR